ncbi:MAG TPA: cysteine-rich CWC family protein [Gemmatimonadaceae bacterium]|nr:cysteine-rich CWC family protein [Gemmatimonadaceae bacterium]
MKPDESEPVERTVMSCSSCGTSFHCGRDDADGCWCARLPALPRERYAANAGCLCEACLRRMLDDPAASRPPG